MCSTDKGVDRHQRVKDIMMGNFLTYVMSELYYINNLISQHKNCKSEHKGSVFRIKSKNRHYFVKQFWKNGKAFRIYLGKEDSAKVREEKRNQLECVLCDTLCHNKRILESVIREFKAYSFEALNARISPSLETVSCGFQIDHRLDQLFAWAQADYKKNSKPFPDKVILAKDGRRVRSKDECIWYNYLLDAGLPFRYDWVMEFDDPWNPGWSISRSPDFVIKTPSGEMVLIEHAGLLMKKDYAEDMKKKIQIYLYNGYVLGDNFFIISEDRFGGINSYAIKRQVAEIKSRFFTC